MVLFVGWLALVVLHLWLVRDITSPGRGPGDQWGYLGSARFIARDPHTYVMPFFPYFTYGYSILLAPLVRLFDDPFDLFVAIKVVNSALAATTLPLLYLFGRCVLDARRGPALAAAAMGSLVWPLMRHPGLILAENLVIPLVVATLLACWLFLSDRPAWQRLLFAPCMVWLHVTHNRFAASLLVFFALLLLVAVTNAVPRRLVAANGGLAVVALVVAQVVRNAIVEARWPAGIFTPQGPASDAIDVLRDRHLLWEYLLVCVGQVWYLAATTLGLALIGIGFVVGRTVRGRGLATDPQRLTLAFLLGLAATVFATSAYFFTRVVNGSEGFVVGRHNESFVAVWVAVAVVFLMAPTPLRRVRFAILGALATTAVVAGILLEGRKGGDLAFIYSNLNVPGLTVFGNVGDFVVQRATVVALSAMVVAGVLALLRVRPTVLLPVAAIWSIVGVSITDQPDQLPEGWDTPDQIEALDVDRAALVAGYQTGVPVYYQYYLPDVQMVPWDGKGPAPEPFVLARLDAGLEAQGGRVAVVDDTARVVLSGPYSVALWVMPGAEQDRLEAMGALEPPGFPADSPS